MKYFQKQIDYLKNIGIEDDKEYLIENLAMMVSAGMDIVSTLDAIKSDVKTPRMKMIINTIKADVEAGETIYGSLAKFNIFPQYVISLIKIGEDSGRLSENLKIITIQQEKNRNFKSKVKSAMMYPVLVLSLTFVIGIGIAYFILPKLAKVFDQLHVKLPFITKLLIGFANFLALNGKIFIPLLFLTLFLIFYFLFVFKKSKFIGEIILFHTPVIKKLIQQVEISRMGCVLGTLLDASIPIVTSIESLSSSVSFYNYHKFYDFLANSIENGSTFKKSFEKYQNINKLIPVPVQNMIIAGEKSAKLSEIFLNLAENFENKIDTTTKNLSTLLEPIMLIIIWLGVVFVALAVILPIYSLIGGFKV